MNRERLLLTLSGPDVLAVGAWFESRAGRVIDHCFHAGPVVGDLIDAQVCRCFDEALDQLCALPGKTPQAVAHDLHPDFHSTRAAIQLADHYGIPAIRVQHHHAHIASVLAEHAWQGPVLGIAADGVGLGTDGASWGGELLWLEGAGFSRMGHLKPLAMPGGDRAAHEPWRLAAAVLHAAGRGDEIQRRFGHHAAAALLPKVIDKPRLSPRTSSLGRYFDAAAALLGLCELNATAAQAPIALERAAQAYGPVATVSELWRSDKDSSLDLTPLFDRLMNESNPGRGAALFHACVATALAEWLLESEAWSAATAVVLGGGCFHNQVLRAHLMQILQQQSKPVLLSGIFSPGDAGIALGQAWVAQRTLEEI